MCHRPNSVNFNNEPFVCNVYRIGMKTPPCFTPFSKSKDYDLQLFPLKSKVDCAYTCILHTSPEVDEQTLHETLNFA